WVPPRAEATRMISGTWDRSNAVISREILALAPDGAARVEPKDVCGPAVPAEEKSSFAEKLAADVALPSTPLTLFDIRPLPRTVTAPPLRESPLRSRSIARCAISPYWSERRGLSLYAGSNTPVHRTIGRAEARSMAGPSA